MGRSTLSRQEIAKRYIAGKSVNELAVMASTSGVSIRNHLAAAGVELQGLKRRRKHDFPAIISDYNSGMALIEVANKHATDPSSVLKILKSNGVPRNGTHARRSGPSHHWWKGGIAKSSGYPISKEGRLHRLEMERIVGRKLECWEAVHHVDGDRENKSSANLVIMPWREHTRFHAFLRARGWEISPRNLRLICRKEPAFVWRFTAEDCRVAKIAHPLPGGRSVLAKPLRACVVKGCNGKRYGHGLCSKHYQRRKAKNNGGWVSGGGRTAKLRQSWLK